MFPPDVYFMWRESILEFTSKSLRLCLLLVCRFSRYGTRLVAELQCVSAVIAVNRLVNVFAFLNILQFLDFIQLYCSYYMSVFVGECGVYC